MTQQVCMSCEVTAGRRETPGGVIYEDEYWSLTHSVIPVQLAGFLILQPKRHVEHVAELTGQEAASIGPLMSASCAALNKLLEPEKVYVCSFGSSVKHVHSYLMPRMTDAPPDIVGGNYLSAVFTGRWACRDDEAADLARYVQVELAQNSDLPTFTKP